MTEDSKIDRQREHQANERTFLAWLRTSIALIGFGFAIARFGIFLQQLQLTLMHQEDSTRPFFNSETLGVSLVIFGIVVIAIAAWRYNQVFWQIERGDYRANRWAIWLITAIVMILGLLSIPLLLWRNKAPVPSSSKQYSNGILFAKNSSLPDGLVHVRFRHGKVPPADSFGRVRRGVRNWLWHRLKPGILSRSRSKNYHH
jgi:putative membrane protein